MMDPDKGRFRPISPERVADLQKELDVQIASGSAPRTRVLPVLAEGEDLDLVIGGPLTSIPVTVERIKQNGKLFVYSSHEEALATVPVGLVVEIKGVHFRVARVNVRGQAGLRMLTKGEVQSWTAAGRPQPPLLVRIDDEIEVTEVPNLSVVVPRLNPESLVSDPFAEKRARQLRRAERNERRRQGLVERRKKNALIQESIEAEKSLRDDPKALAIPRRQFDRAEGERLAQERRARKKAERLARRPKKIVVEQKPKARVLPVPNFDSRVITVTLVGS